MKKINIGTSGWYYDDWKKVFYPENLKISDRLSFYASHFNTVEVNNTFYRLPSKNAIANWYDCTPVGFIFSIKASNYITHRKRLLDPKKSLKLFFERIAPLKDKLGPLLFQLPPSFKMNFERLEAFIKELPNNYLITFEFRHPSWYVKEVYDLLAKNNISLCITDLEGRLSEEKLTASFVYIRLHGPKHAYRGSYSPPKIKQWSEKIKKWSHQRDVFCNFDNDEKGFAIKDAKRLIKSMSL